MPLNLIAFGQLAGITGSSVVLNEALTDTDGLQVYLHKHYPALLQLNYKIAVNKQIAQTNMPIIEGATIALLPPFSGG